jgi:hypothetical protein
MCEECNLRQPSRKLKTHCIRCYSFLNPTKQASLIFKTKENYVINKLLDLIKENIKDINMDDFKRDKIINNGCSKRRPDLFLDLYTHSIIVENDEDQHDTYDPTCENKRMVQIFEDLGSRPIVFLRFNCDSYTINDKKQSSLFKFDTKVGLYTIKNKNIFNERLKYLFNVFYKHYVNIPEKEFTIEKLFYNQQILTQ